MTQTTPSEFGRAASFVRIALASTATAACLALVGAWPTVAQAGRAGTVAMLVGIAVALLGGWAGSAVTVASLRRPARDHSSGIMLGLGVRFGVTLGLALAVSLTRAFAPVPLLLWVAIGHVVLLAVDVVALIGLLKRASKDAS